MLHYLYHQKLDLEINVLVVSNATAFVDAKRFITLGSELQKRILHCLGGEQFSLEFVFDCFNSLIVSMNELMNSQAVGQSNSSMFKHLSFQTVEESNS